MDQNTLDKMADVIWWLKGYTEAKEDPEIMAHHIYALSQARKYIMNDMKKKEVK